MPLAIRAALALALAALPFTAAAQPAGYPSKAIRMIIPLAPPLRVHVESMPACHDAKAPLHPRAFRVLAQRGNSSMLSRQFSELLAQHIRQMAGDKQRGFREIDRRRKASDRK